MIFLILCPLVGLLLAFWFSKVITFDFIDYLARKEGLVFRASTTPEKALECGEVSFGWVASPVGCIIYYYPDAFALQERGDSRELILDVNCFTILERGGRQRVIGMKSGLELRFDGHVEKVLIPWLNQKLSKA